MTTVTPQNFDRLARAMMERHHVTYTVARNMLAELRLHLICGEGIRTSVALQAAVLTAINTGKRAFRGGVSISLPNDVELCLPWPVRDSFNEVAYFLGATESHAAPAENVRSLTFGATTPIKGSLLVVCDGWRAGLSPVESPTTFTPGPDFALGGVMAGALGVARCFLSDSEISRRDISAPIGFSIWRHELSWLSPEAVGPPIHSLPSKFWLLGLGHLGQAYTWSLGLLPYNRKDRPVVWLQDVDVAEEGNWSAGLLCESQNVNELKSRICATWLEARGINTRLVERRFDANTKRVGDESRIALCGFDNPESRQILEDAGFELVVEAGLGGSVDRFDRIVMHTFPAASEHARDIWANRPVQQAENKIEIERIEGDCGIIAEEIAGKAISTAFTGAFASALVLGEVLKAIHGGKRREFLAVQLRDLETPESPPMDENYQLRVARNGTLPINEAIKPAS